jgi:hypothetical protein
LAVGIDDRSSAHDQVAVVIKSGYFVFANLQTQDLGTVAGIEHAGNARWSACHAGQADYSSSEHTSIRRAFGVDARAVCRSREQAVNVTFAV